MKTISTSPYIQSKNQLLQIKPLPGYDHVNHLHLQKDGEEKIVRLVGGEVALELLRNSVAKFNTDWRDFIVVTYSFNGPYAKVHEIPVVYEKVVSTCTRCAGTGHLPQYNHIRSGVCFRCENTSPKRERWVIRPEQPKNLRGCSVCGMDEWCGTDGCPRDPQ